MVILLLDIYISWEITKDCAGLNVVWPNTSKAILEECGRLSTFDAAMIINPLSDKQNL